MQNTDVGKTWHTVSLIPGHPRRDPDVQVTSLAHVLDGEYLGDCSESLNRKRAVGIDNARWEEYGKGLNEQLVSRLKRKSYKPIPARRVYIPKSETEKRPLGIFAVENTIGERGITWIRESIYEEDVLKRSYGFRGNRNAHQAGKEVIMYQPVNHIVEADRKGFFDNVSHEKLMEGIRIRVGDTRLLNLRERFLKAGYGDDDAGTPQGSILSPMLANIFLHYVLDTWFETTGKSQVRGCCELVRYADDYVCLVRYAEDARRIERALHNRFTKYALELHPAKSRTFSFGRFERMNAQARKRRANTFNFLGFTHYCGISRSGNFKVARKASRKKYTATGKELNTWLKKIRNSMRTKEWWETLIAKLRGHFQCYSVSENYRGIARFYTYALRVVHKWMNRRSQKRKMNWERCNTYLEHYSLTKPKIVHSFYISPVR